jgi:mannan endo-1,4-beta-mannosidase
MEILRMIVMIWQTAILLTCSACNTSTETDGGSTSTPSSFVSVDENSNFVLNGETFRFVGTNAYYLQNYQKLDPLVVDRAFGAFEEAGIRVVRMWAFYDGYDCGYSQYDNSENVIQTSPGMYNESALQDLDRVIAKGKARGIYFILTLLNYWDELGGICQYNTWDGIPNPSTNMSHFIKSENAQRWFKEYIEMLLNRQNIITGVSYKNEPAIFSWQIINEARNSGQDPAILRDWYQEIAEYIKSIDSNHMVSTGEEGFDEDMPNQYSISEYSNTYVLRANEGTSYLMNVAIPEIDYGNAHWYPADWGFGYDVRDANVTKAQNAWLSDHEKIARALNKPFILDEYGYAGWGNAEVLFIYSKLWDFGEQIQLDGSLIWQFTADYIKCYEFGGNICWPGGRQDQTLYSNFRSHIQNMQNN